MRNPSACDRASKYNGRYNLKQPSEATAIALMRRAIDLQHRNRRRGTRSAARRKASLQCNNTRYTKIADAICQIGASRRLQFSRKLLPLAQSMFL
jgi:hypothetical protein